MKRTCGARSTATPYEAALRAMKRYCSSLVLHYIYSAEFEYRFHPVAVDIAITPTAEPFFHNHNCTELIFVRSGQGFVYHNAKKTPYHTNQHIVYQRGASHADKAECDGIQFCIGIDGAAAEYVPIGVWNCSQKIINVIAQIYHT